MTPRVWSFASYEEYTSYQVANAKRSRGITRRHAGLRQRLGELLRSHAPTATSLLCLGARSSLEVQDFLGMGFQAEGIDLYADKLIHLCDMSDLDGNERYRDRFFDAFVFIHSLEHCLDLDGLRRRSLPHCRQVIAVAVPLEVRSKLSPWDCVAFDFQRPDAPAESIEHEFPGFRIIHREILGDVLLFLLRRVESHAIAADGSRSTAMAGRFKNVMTAHHVQSDVRARSALERLLCAQIENSLEVGWNQEDLLVLTSFPFRWREFESIPLETTGRCLRDYRILALRQLLRQELASNTILWFHDLDCWQNIWFDPPEFKDVGACEHGPSNFSDGSIFWRPSARDIACEIVDRLQSNSADSEEPTIKRVLNEARFRHRVTALNATYNVGCSGFKGRFARSVKPVYVSRFQPKNRLAWETHALDRHGLGERSASPRLEQLLRRWYVNLPTSVTVPD